MLLTFVALYLISLIFCFWIIGGHRPTHGHFYTRDFPNNLFADDDSFWGKLVGWFIFLLILLGIFNILPNQQLKTTGVYCLEASVFAFLTLAFLSRFPACLGNYSGLDDRFVYLRINSPLILHKLFYVSIVTIIYSVIFALASGDFQTLLAIILSLIHLPGSLLSIMPLGSTEQEFLIVANRYIFVAGITIAILSFVSIIIAMIYQSTIGYSNAKKWYKEYYKTHSK